MKTIAGAALKESIDAAFVRAAGTDRVPRSDGWWGKIGVIAFGILAVAYYNTYATYNPPAFVPTPFPVPTLRPEVVAKMVNTPEDYLQMLEFVVVGGLGLFVPLWLWERVQKLRGRED